MALFIGKASERALKATSNCIKNSLRTTTSKNKQFDVSNHSVPRKNAIWCSITLNNGNYQGEFRSLSTSTSYNSDMYFTKKHEWVSVVGNMGTVGITDYAQQSLGNKRTIRLTNKHQN